VAQQTAVHSVSAARAISQQDTLGHIYGSLTVIGAVSTDILDFRARVLVIQVATGGDGRATLIPETVVVGQNIS
jgi:hypothetical protein